MNSGSKPKYKDYLLKDNPFPQTATLEPSSHDPRTSGEIFNDKIFAEEIDDLWKRIDSKINVIYVSQASGVWELGIGKSALVYNVCKSLKEKSEATAVYLRASTKSRPSDFCNQIVAKWHSDGYLWEAFRDLLQGYKSSRSSKIPADKIDSFLQTYESLPDRVQLRVFTFEREDKVAVDIQKWAQSRDNSLIPEVTRAFFETYLTFPNGFVERWNGLKVKGNDDIDFFATVLKLLSLTKIAYHYFVIDQFEDAVRGNQGKNQLANFCSEMRRIIVACAGKATILVTLHPESEDILSQRGGEHLIGLAGLDDRHKLDIKEITRDEAVGLALSYLRYFRLPNTNPKNDLYPLDDDIVRYVRHIKGGRPRDILQALSTAIEVGVQNHCVKLDLEFLKKYHRQVLGKVLDDDIFKTFKKSVS
jgi:hypothetical protein